MRFLLSGEAQILQSISASAPLPEVLNGICSALDGQIGNVVSLVCLREDAAADLAAIAGNPKHFGLYTFCSAGVFDENDELLGSLEMYCCAPRSPSLEEIHLIERATCLAAIAIKRFIEAGDDGSSCIDELPPLSGYVLKWPDSMN
ncbi:MAG TPA: hypothetical protein VGK99_10650 [Acidobacteriota bacterium]